METNSFVVFLNQTMLFYKNMFSLFLRSIRNYWYISLLALILFGSFYYFYAQSVKGYFTGNASFTFSYLNKKVYGDRLLNLQQLIEKGDPSSLAKKLKIHPKTAVKIQGLHAKNIAGSPLHEDYTEEKFPFYIEVIATDRAAFEGLEEHILHYLNHQAFDSTYILFEQKKLRKKADLLAVQFKQIDSLRQQISLAQLAKYSETMSLLESIANQQVTVEKQLQQKESISLLTQFVPLHTSRKEIITKHVKKLGLLYLFFVVFSSVLLQLNFKQQHD